MFIFAGNTDPKPYKGKRGQQRWQKMRENVIKEWEAEQVPAEEKAQARQHPEQPQATRSSPVAEHGDERISEAGHGIGVGHHVPDSRDSHRNGPEHKKSSEGVVKANSESHKKESIMHKLKEKLSKH
ncbi:hypothetical protein FB567DRAFT_555899 [Paraphoma chrysanthemicola]|uniref:Uncharacterized protein n=1 Tax=Paraphoma chrysanthemicola TaxID=798071 RepID=A0A8K0QRL2_9PLEO|nr:hypothetical protein FB567DRAFT_555899 [Paraphoma chrysanthemicola]